MTNPVVWFDTESPPGSWAEALRFKGFDSSGDRSLQQTHTDHVNEEIKPYQGMADSGFKASGR